jgi:hypothetical protein
LEFSIFGWGGAKKWDGASNGARGGAMSSSVSKSFSVGKTHLFDRRMLARVNAAIMLGLVGSGLAACAIGALVYDVGRWFSAW